MTGHSGPPNVVVHAALRTAHRSGLCRGVPLNVRSPELRAAIGALASNYSTKHGAVLLFNDDVSFIYVSEPFGKFRLGLGLDFRSDVVLHELVGGE